LDELVQLISNTTDAFTTALFLRHPQEEYYYLASYYSLSKHVDPHYTFLEGQGFWGWVAKHGKPLNISPFNSEYKPLNIYRRNEGIKSFAAVPLDGKSGVLSVDSKSTYVFTDRITKLLMDFGRMAVNLHHLEDELNLAQESVGFFEFLMTMEQRLAGDPDKETLAQILDQCRILMGAEMIFWAEYTPDNKKYFLVMVEGRYKGHPFLERTFSAEQGLVGLIFRKKKPLFLEKLNIKSPKSFLFQPKEPLFQVSSFAGLPVNVGETVWGGLGLASSEPRNWSRTEMQTLGLVSALLAPLMLREV